MVRLDRQRVVSNNLGEGMVISGILEYRRSLEVLNNYTIGSDIEVNPEGQTFYFTTKMIWDWDADMYNGISTISESESSRYHQEIINC